MFTNHTQFLHVLGAELRLRAVHFEQADLIAFIEAAWSRVAQNSAPSHWARLFGNSCARLAIGSSAGGGSWTG